MSFKCPVCGLGLVLQSNSYKCQNNHLYDISKYGYVNLLMANQKRSKVPGDAEEMTKSRNAFLNKGYYYPLAQKIDQLIVKSNSLKNQTILDVGCGTGYYLSEIKGDYDLYGIDISKSAVQLASKRKTGAKLAVASAYNLPFLDQTFDLIYSVFSPVSPNEFYRVLKNGAITIVVGPAEDHLEGLAKNIYDTFIPHAGNNVMDEDNRFKLIETLQIKENINIAKNDILDLVKMTPYYWQMNKEQLSKLSLLENIETPIHFTIKKYQKKDE